MAQIAFLYGLSAWWLTHGAGLAFAVLLFAAVGMLVSALAMAVGWLLDRAKPPG